MRVLELGDYVSAAWCCKILARWGAEVIKAEFPGGDLARKVGPFKDGVPHPETSALYLYLNTGKKSITLNPLVASGAKLLSRLADQCDIIVCNLSRQIVEDLDLPGYAARHPEKAVVSITPFGLTGPYSHFEGTLGVVIALGGYSHIMGDPGRDPLAMPGWYPEYEAGAYACSGALAAWLGKDVRPVGSILDVSLMEVLAALHFYTTVTYTYAGRIRSRQGTRYERTHPAALLPCKDGWILIGCMGNHYWERFCMMIGHMELFENPRYQAQRDRRLYADEIDAVIGPWLKERTGAEILKEAQEVYRLPVGPMMGMGALLSDEHLNARRFWQEIDHPVAGRLTYPSSAYRMDEVPPVDRRAPLLGEHNEEIYDSLLGLSHEEQARLRQMGVI